VSAITILMTAWTAQSHCLRRISPVVHSVVIISIDYLSPQRQLVPSTGCWRVACLKSIRASWPAYPQFCRIDKPQTIPTHIQSS
jgi:hypothetical protein